MVNYDYNSIKMIAPKELLKSIERKSRTFARADDEYVRVDVAIAAMREFSKRQNASLLIELKKLKHDR